jgi:hypothetical protein
MWVRFISLYSLDQWIHYFFTSPLSLQLVNSLKIITNQVLPHNTILKYFGINKSFKSM